MHLIPSMAMMLALDSWDDSLIGRGYDEEDMIWLSQVASAPSHRPVIDDKPAVQNNYNVDEDGMPELIPYNKVRLLLQEIDGDKAAGDTAQGGDDACDKVTELRRF
jgi:hypothetical protein